MDFYFIENKTVNFPDRKQKYLLKLRGQRRRKRGAGLKIVIMGAGGSVHRRNSVGPKASAEHEVSVVTMQG